MIAGASDQPNGAAAEIHQEDAAAVTFAPKRDLTSIGGEGRLRVVRLRVSRKIPRLHAPELLQVQVPSAAIEPGVDNGPTVRGERRIRTSRLFIGHSGEIRKCRRNIAAAEPEERYPNGYEAATCNRWPNSSSPKRRTSRCNQGRRRLGWRREDTFAAECREISSARELDSQIGFVSCSFVVLQEASSQTARLHPDDGIQARIEISAPVEDLDTESVLLQFWAATLEMPFHQVAQQSLLARSPGENLACEHCLQVLTDRFGRDDRTSQCYLRLTS